MADDQDFNVEPLSSVAARLLEGLQSPPEQVCILASRADFAQPYALEVKIPAPGDVGRERGLELLWARFVSVAAAIVGSSTLRLVCDSDSTFEFVRERLERSPKVKANLQQYGAVSVERAAKTDIPEVLRNLPFLSRSGAERKRKADTDADMDVCSVPSGDQLYVGVDFGRSDVKVAVCDAAGAVLSTHVTRWWRARGDEREYLDPQQLESHELHVKCMEEAVVDALAKIADAAGKVIYGFGLSAAGCVQGGRLCGIPPTFGGAEPAAAGAALPSLDRFLLEKLRRRARVDDACPSVMVNDGDASALYGASNLAAGRVGLFLSCGTGLAGGIVSDARCCEGVLELGKVVVGLRKSEGGIVPEHDGMSVEGVAQGMAGTQRSFFNLLAARGGERITGKAEQRAALVKMQKDGLKDDVRDIFACLGGWLAKFVVELNSYLPRSVDYVEAGGKLTDAATGDIMLKSAGDALGPFGVRDVKRADDSEFGQAIAMAQLTLKK